MKKNEFNNIEGLTSFTKRLELPGLSKQFSELMDKEGVTLAELLEGLAEERLAIYQEKYGGSAKRFSHDLESGKTAYH
jgi:hypothetical protein